MTASAFALFVMGALACQQPQKATFSFDGTSIVWPKPPDTPRIRYIGQITGEESLKAKKSGWPSLSELIAGPKPKIGFSTPMSVAVLGETIYVADGQNKAAYRLDIASGTINVIDSAAGAPLQWPIDLAVAANRLAVVDSRRASVFLFDLTGRFIQSMGEGRFQRPTAIAWNTVKEQWWVLDTAAHACLIFDKNGQLQRTLGSRGNERGEFNFPAGLACHTSYGAVVADSMNFRVQVIDHEGNPTLDFGQKGDAAGDFSMPRDAAVDSEAHIYVLDNQFENIQVFDGEGRLLLGFGQEGRGPGEFNLPSGMTIDSRDRIWIADTYNRRVQVFQYLSETEQ